MWGANAQERARLREVEGHKASKGGTDLLGGQWLRIHLATQGMSVRSLIRKLRSHMPEVTKPMLCNKDPAQKTKQTNKRQKKKNQVKQTRH